MRPSRRTFLKLAGAAVLSSGAASAAPRLASGPTPVEVRVSTIDAFAAGGRRDDRIGALAFRSGLELQADHPAFGGFSGLWRSPDGEGLVAISDNAHWLTAKVESRGDRLVGLRDAVIAPMLGADGRPLRNTRFYDTEALTIADGIATVGIERVHAAVQFDFGRSGVMAKARPVRLPDEVRSWPSNASIEAIGVAPRTSPLAGALVIVAESSRGGEDAPTQGFIVTGSRRGAFDVVRTEGYDVTDLAFLPDGDILVLERRFSLFRGIGTRLRRLPGRDLAPGARLDGPVLMEADSGYQIDNMEGLALHRAPGGETRVTLISDNNFSLVQRTLLLEFALLED